MKILCRYFTVKHPCWYSCTDSYMIQILLCVFSDPYIITIYINNRLIFLWKLSELLIFMPVFGIKHDLMFGHQPFCSMSNHSQVCVHNPVRSVNQFAIFFIFDVIDQNESEVGNDMLLVSDYFYASKRMSIEFETRHLWTPTIL